MKIGVVGNGYVGGAIAHGFSPTSTGNCEVKVYDKLPERTLNTLDETVNDSDFVFVSVKIQTGSNITDGKHTISISFVKIY